jgi:predicted nucleotidyltransferase
MKMLSEYKILLHDYLQHQAVKYGVTRMGIFG